MGPYFLLKGPVQLWLMDLRHRRSDLRLLISKLMRQADQVLRMTSRVHESRSIVGENLANNRLLALFL